MQIFALFMLCGTLVSFLVPETKGRTLEELAGEGSTALDSRNGSVVLASGFAGWLARHNPFRGGKPAGFSYRSPNLGPKSPGIRGKRERLGIMTSPELLDKNKRGKKDKGEKGHVRGPSEESGSQGYSVSVSSHGRRADDNDDLYLSGAVQGTLPGWGAGWGVQKNHDRRTPGRVESIQLHDVGSLLK